MADQVLYVDNELGNNSNAGIGPGASAKRNLFSAISALSGHTGNHTIWVKARSSGVWTGETTYCNLANLVDGATVVVEGYSSTPGDRPTGDARPLILLNPNWDYLRDSSTTTSKLATFRCLRFNHESNANNWLFCLVASTSGLGLTFENCWFRRQTPANTTMFQLLRTTSTRPFTFVDCHFDGSDTSLGGFVLDIRGASTLRFIRCRFDTSDTFVPDIIGLSTGGATYNLVEFTGCTGRFPGLITGTTPAVILQAIFHDNDWTIVRGPIFYWARDAAGSDTVRFLSFCNNTVALTGDLVGGSLLGFGVGSEDPNPPYRPVARILDNRIYHVGGSPQTATSTHLVFVGHNCGGVRIERNVIVDYRVPGSAYGIVFKGLGGGSIRNNVLCASYGLYLVGCAGVTVENNVLMTSVGTVGERACVGFATTAGGTVPPVGCILRRNILCGLGRANSVGIKSPISVINPANIQAVSDENIFYNLQYLSNFQTAGPTDNFTTTLAGLQSSWVAHTTRCALFGNDLNSRVADPGIRNWTGTRLEDFGINSWASPAAPPLSSRTDNGYGCMRPRWKRHGVPKTVFLGGQS